MLQNAKKQNKTKQQQQTNKAKQKTNKKKKPVWADLSRRDRSVAGAWLSNKVKIPV